MTDNTNASQNGFVINLISTSLPGRTYTNIRCGYGCSGHASWHSRGFAVSMPFEATMNTSNPYIHTASDTLSRSSGNANNSVKFAMLAAAFMGELAKGVGLLQHGGHVGPVAHTTTWSSRCSDVSPSLLP